MILETVDPEIWVSRSGVDGFEACLSLPYFSRVLIETWTGLENRRYEETAPECANPSAPR